MKPHTEQLKACLFNLIIFTENGCRTEYFLNIVHSIIEKFPCRVIFIRSGEKEISVSQELIGKPGSYTSCDLINIECSTEELDHVPYLTLQNIVPDLPIYLLWGQLPTISNPLFDQLKRYANRIVFDAESAENIQLFSKVILDQIQSTEIDIMDIDWALISRWRHVFAQIFDSEEMLEILSECEILKIRYNARKTVFCRHTSTRALYLQAWIAAHMNWKIKSVHGQSVEYTTPKGNCRVELEPGECEQLHSSSILQINLESDHHGTICITRFENQPKITVHISNHSKCELPFTLPLFDPHRGLTFVKEMFFYQPSDHYRETMAMIASSDWETK